MNAITAKLQKDLFTKIEAAQKLMLDNPEATALLDAAWDMLWDADTIKAK